MTNVTVTEVGNTGRTTLNHVPYYITGVACDATGNVYTVHNWDEPHFDIIRWDPNTGANVWNSGYHSAPTLEWICVEPTGTFAYVIGYVGSPFDPTRTSTPGSGSNLTFGVYKYNLTSPGVPTAVVIPYNNVKVPYTSGSTALDQWAEAYPLNAIALSGTNVYFTDAIAGKVYAYNTTTFANTLTISGITIPNGLAIDGSGNIWVGNQHTQVSVYNSAGTLLATPITGLTDVWSLAISGSTLYVLDQGGSGIQLAPGANGAIKKYSISGSSATLQSTFGHTATTGDTSPLGFGQLRSVAADSSGNFIVSQFVATDNGSRLIKFNSSGVFQWEQNCLEFASCLAYSAANPNRLISNSRHVYSATRNPNSAAWAGTGRTDYGSYWGLTLQGSTGGKCKVLTFGGNDFFYYLGSASNAVDAIGNAGSLAIYRVMPSGSGAALQLASCLSLQQPGADGLMYGNTTFQYQWSWQDQTGQGMTSINSSTVLGGAGLTTDKGPGNVGSWAWYISSINVDPNGTLWIASYNRLFSGVHTYTEVWAIPLNGLTSSGNPIYHWADAVNILTTSKLLSDANISSSPTGAYIQTLDYDPVAKMLYLAMHDPNAVPTGANTQSNTLLAYSNISGLGAITTSPAFLVKPSQYFVDVCAVPGQGYILTQPLGAGNTGLVEQYDTTGVFVQSYAPDSTYISTPGVPTGSFDCFGAINAQIAPDGSIDIFAEDDLNGRIFWYNASYVSNFSPKAIISDLPSSNTLASPLALNNNAVAMVSYRQNWSLLQPTAPTGGITNNPADPSWNWAFFDSAIAQAKQYNKFCFFRVLLQESNCPGWVAAGTQQFLTIAGTSVNIWWDTFYQAAVIALVQAMASRYASNPLVREISFNIASTSSGDWSIPHGTNANWTNTSSFIVPAVGSTVNVQTGGVNAGMNLGQYCFVPGGGWFMANANSGAIHTTLLNQGTAGNASPGTTVPINTTIQVSDVGTLQGPVFNYTTSRLETALDNLMVAVKNAWPNQIYSHEVGRNGTLDPFPGATSYTYNAATQLAQYGYANFPIGKFAISKNTLSGANPFPPAALAQQDGSDIYLPAQTISGSTNTSGTTGTIPVGSALNGQFLWQCWDPTGQYLPSTTGPSGKPYYANSGTPYTDPAPIFKYVRDLAGAYGVHVLETYELDVINLMLAGYSNYKSISHQSVLFSVARRMGLDPLVTLTTPTAQAYLTYIDERCREAWERFDWTDLTIVEQRAFEDPYQAAVTYAQGNSVFDWSSMLYWTSLQNGNLNNPPATSPTWWGAATLYAPFIIPTKQVTYDEIGTVYGITATDPTVYTNPNDVGWERNQSGIILYPDRVYSDSTPYGALQVQGSPIPGQIVGYNGQFPTTVWVQYRLPYPGMATTYYSSTQTYNAGDLAFWNTDTYQSAVTQTNASPTQSPNTWQIIKFPYVLSEFVKKAAFVDALIDDGQHEKGGLEEPKAYTCLDREYDKQILQQGQQSFYTASGV